MKKIFLLLITFISLLLTGCDNSIYSNYKAKNKGNYTTYQNITYNDYTEKLSNKNSFVLFVWQTGCTHCEEFEPKLNKIISYYGLEIYGLNLKELDDNQYAKFKNKTFVSGTPALVYFEDGAYEEKLVGDKSEEDVISFLNNIDYLEEK